MQSPLLTMAITVRCFDLCDLFLSAWPAIEHLSHHRKGTDSLTACASARRIALRDRRHEHGQLTTALHASYVHVHAR